MSTRITPIIWLICFLVILLPAGYTRPVNAFEPAGAVAAPTLKWAYGGCFSSWCQTGWYASPAVADLDKDGQVEVIWGSYDVVALNGSTGSLKWRAASSSRVWPGVAVADLTGDGSLEVIVGRNSDQVTVYNSAGGVIWTRQPFGSGEVRTLAVADLETDGQMEIIVGRASGGATRQLSVYEPDGSVRPGWPARRDGEPGYGWGMYNENVAVADLDGDGYKEIIGPTDTHYITGLARDGSQLPANPLYGAGKVWSQVGVHVDQAADLRGYANCGLEHRPNFANSAPAIADVNGDGVLEIVVVGNVYNCAIGNNEAGDLYYLPWILKLDRTRWSGSGFNWTVIPAAAPGSGPLSEDYNVIQNVAANAVVADLDGDGFREILYPSYDGRLHAYWLDKTQHGSWPYKVPGTGYRFASEPAVVDIDHDGQAEVIFTSWPQNGGNRRGQLHILNPMGQPLHALDLPAPRGSDWNGGLGGPTVANIDADADLEIVIGTTGSGVVAYDLPGSANAALLWGTGRGSYQRTGLAAAEAGFSLSGQPVFRAIEAGGSAAYTILVRAGADFSGPVTLAATSPGPGLSVNLAPTSLTPPGQATLTLTDTHPPGPLVPGLVYLVPVTASGGGLTRTTSVTLLVGGTRVYQPLILK